MELHPEFLIRCSFFETNLPFLEDRDVILAAIFDLIQELEKNAKHKLHIRKYFASFYPQTLLLLLKEVENGLITFDL